MLKEAQCGKFVPRLRRDQRLKTIKFFFQHDHAPGIWCLICEVISLITLSEDHLLAHRRENPLSFLQRTQKHAVKTKMEHKQPLGGGGPSPHFQCP